MGSSQSHRATYDSEGNILLPGADMPAVHVAKEYAWEITEESEAIADQTKTLHDVRVQVKHVAELTRHAMHEGVHQYRVSIDAVPDTLSSLQRETHGMLSHIRQFLPRRSKDQSRTSSGRSVAFVVDIFRFGLTFTAIFVALFAALNYQSFWQIATARIAPLLEGPSFTSPIAAVGSRDDSSAISGLLAFLPPVGPPTDRLIIPKLTISVPLVSPPTTALLNQDWEQVEKDIQDALQDGVVHYPGTARAGQAGNFFITGHSSYYPWSPGDYKTVFARLHELEEGDEYIVYFQGDKHRYKIESKKEVKPTDVTVLDQPVDRRISTLMTCTPVGTTLRRLILVAQEIDPISGDNLAVGEHANERPQAAPLGALPI
jgi:LPXTG-site transpeptidase (sortase) family protein